jgi:hypothetical protein
MATRSITFVNPDIAEQGGPTRLFTATGLTQATLDDTAPLNCAHADALAVQLTGTLGAAGAIQPEGRITPAGAWVSLGAALTALGLTNLSSSLPLAEFRLRVTAGDGTTSLAAAIIMRRAPNPAG